MNIAQLEAAIAAYKEATGKPVKAMVLGTAIIRELELELDQLIICEPQAPEGTLFGIPVLQVDEDPYLLLLASVDPVGLPA